MFNFDEIRHRKCPICEGTIKNFYSVESELGKFQIDRCSSCGFAFVNPTPSDEYIVDFYKSSDKQGRSTHSSLEDVLADEARYPNATLDGERIAARIKRLTKKSGRLLDVGCGYGFFSKAAKDAGFEVDCLEIADVERRIATDYLGRSPVATTFELFQSSEKYDAAIFSQVLEHAREPLNWMRKMRDLSSPAAVVAIALPNFSALTTDLLGAKDPYVIPPAHLNYFSPDNLTRLLERAGYQVEEIETVSRIPKRTFERRFGRAIANIAFPLSGLALGAIDVVKKGIMLNVYARAA